jgi:putative endonuclease
MLFYVYIIRSEKDDSYYKGFSEDPVKRLEQHNRGEATYTSIRMPWVLVYIEVFETKREALAREINLKKYSIERIDKLIRSPKNILDRFQKGKVG